MAGRLNWRYIHGDSERHEEPRALIMMPAIQSKAGTTTRCAVGPLPAHDCLLPSRRESEIERSRGRCKADAGTRFNRGCVAVLLQGRSGLRRPVPRCPHVSLRNATYTPTWPDGLSHGHRLTKLFVRRGYIRRHTLSSTSYAVLPQPSEDPKKSPTRWLR
jgi:hypothetical protein